MRLSVGPAFLVAFFLGCLGGCGKSGARPGDGGQAGQGGSGGNIQVDAPQDMTSVDKPTPPDVAADLGDDSGATTDGPDQEVDPDPSLCTNTKRCDPIVEVCTEDEGNRPPAGIGYADSCGTRWDCYTHDDDDGNGTLEHPCPPEGVDFCGCDGVTFSRPWYCVDRPYDHIGACGDGYSCDPNRVQCSDPEPTCPDGQIAAVVNNCWGPCIPFSDCRCDFIWQCRPTGQYTCSGFPGFRCIPRNVDGGTDGATDSQSSD